MTELSVPELRQSVEELRLAVSGLAARVGSLSASLNDLNGVQRRQQEIGAKATAAIEEANRVAKQIAVVEQTVVPREEHQRILEAERLGRRRRSRHVAYLVLAGIMAMYFAIFTVQPVVTNQCIINGPHTSTEQQVCNTVSPFQSHPMGGTRKLLTDVTKQISANTVHLKELEQGKKPTPIDTTFTRAPDSRFDFTSQGALYLDVCVVLAASGFVVWARRQDELDRRHIAALQVAQPAE